MKGTEEFRHVLKGQGVASVSLAKIGAGTNTSFKVALELDPATACEYGHNDVVGHLFTGGLDPIVFILALTQTVANMHPF